MLVTDYFLWQVILLLQLLVLFEPLQLVTQTIFIFTLQTILSFY